MITSTTLKVTIAKNVSTIGRIAKFNNVDRRLFQSFEAESISEALSSAIRQITVMMLISDTPVRENALTIADVVLNALVVLNVLVVLKILLAAIVLVIELVVLIVLDSVLSIDDNNLISHLPAYYRPNLTKEYK
ncbi:MAG: hypothetical protein ACE14P_02805 [Methanotrichaceae archaeon]